jgi:hypothetical protein
MLCPALCRIREFYRSTRIPSARQILAITGAPGARGFRVTGWLTRFWQYWQSALISPLCSFVFFVVQAFGFQILAITQWFCFSDYLVPFAFLCVLCGKNCCI